MSSTSSTQFTKEICARDPHEPNRTSTTLELFFDLVYVIAVSAAAKGFYNQLSELDITGFITFTLAFFILWNAWTSFTWFGSGYDPDDTNYRISVLFQMLGSLMIASNINQFFDSGLTWVGVVGYAIMRLASCSQWWRVYQHVPDHKSVAGRSIIGLLVLQCMWISWLFLPSSIQTPALFTFIVAELIMPIWARSEQFNNWHPEHLAERYGLLTIIVLGEGMVGVSTTMQHFITQPTYHTGSIFLLCAFLISLLFFSWWLYFNIPFNEILAREHRRHNLILFGYGHFFIFASLAGLGASLNLVPNAIAHASDNIAHNVSPIYAICMILLQLLAFLSILTLMRKTICHQSTHNMAALTTAISIIAISIFIVYLGLPILYGIGVSVLAPVSMIAWFRRDTRNTDDHFERA